MSSDGASSDNCEEVLTPTTSSTKPPDTCDSESDDNFNLEFKNWHAVVDSCAGHFESVHRLSASELKSLREDSTDALPCIVVEPRQTKHHKIEFTVVLATRSLAAAIGSSSSYLVGSTGLKFLQVEPPTVDEILNQKAWSQLHRFQSDFLRLPCCSSPGPMRVLLLSARGDAAPCWSLLESIGVTLPGASSTSGRYIVYVLRHLQAPVPRALWGQGALQHEECIKMVVSRLRTGIATKATKGMVSHLLSEVVEQTEAHLVETLEGSQLGDNFVPRLGQEAAKTFESQCLWGSLVENMRDQFEKLWRLSPDDCELLLDDEYDALACTVARPCAADCPLVYASSGFEKLGGYSRTWALGRNWRFLQPKSKERNQAFNKNQLKRLKQFNQKLQGRLLTIMLQEKADDTTFWGLTLVEHVSLESNYVVAVHKELAHESGLLDRLIGRVWSEQGAASLELLVSALGRREASLPQGRPVLQVLWEAFREWLSEVSHDVQEWWHGSSFVAQVGQSAVTDFARLCPVSGEVPTAVRTALREIAGSAVPEATFTKWLAQASYCVADPEFVDCPLVYVSPGFEADTGYDRNYALGRNCRFLQPTTGILHNAFNAEEAQHIARVLASRKPGRVVDALLLNERRNGQRFWNLLCLCHVDICGRHYIVGLQKDVGVQMPALLESQEASEAVIDFNGQEFELFLAQLGPRLTELRTQLHRGFEDIGVATAKAREGLVSLLKCLWMVYNDDGRVPRAKGKRVEIFEQDDLWRAILDAVEPTLLHLYHVDVSDGHSSGCNVSCAVADTSSTDNVLIFISKEFEALTGYQRDWCIGRNCRFLQPANAEINRLLNETELELMRDWIRQHREQPSQFTALLVNEAHDECPFWNFLLMESVSVDGRPYVFAVQMSLDFELPNLAELLGMDWLGLKELERLRKKLRGVIELANSSKVTIREAVRDRVGHWVRGLPPVLRLPSLAGMGPAVASLELGGRTDFLPAISGALRDGVRHFHVTFNGADRPQADERMAELEGRLRALRLAEALNGLKKCHLHYLRSAVSFTLVTPVLLLTAFAEFGKAITSSGYALDCWLLDVRGASTAKVQECWRTMSQAKRSREVGRIGVWGASRPVLEALMEDPQGEKPSVCAVETYLGKEGDHAHHSLMDYIRKLGLAVLAYHVYGPKNFLLEADFVKAESLRMGVESTILAIKWAEARGYGTVVPKLRCGSAGDTSSRGEAEAAAERRLSVGLLGEETSEGGDSSKDGKLGMHRSFVHEYLHAPSAERCAVIMEAAAGAQARERPGLFSQPGRAPNKQLHRRGSGATPDPDRPSATSTMQNLLTEQASLSRKTGPARRHTITGNLLVESEPLVPKLAPDRVERIRSEDVSRQTSERQAQRASDKELPQLARNPRHRTTLAVINVEEAEHPTPRRRSVPTPTSTGGQSLLAGSSLVLPPAPSGPPSPAGAPAGPRSPSAARRLAPAAPRSQAPSPTPPAAPSPRGQASLPPSPSSSLGPAQAGALEAQEPLPGAPELLARAAVNLQNKGWNIQDVAELFGLPVQTVVDTLARASQCPAGSWAP